MTHEIAPVTVRAARAEDRPALLRLAALDSAAPPAGQVLVAEVGGELRAALSIGDRTAIADPFHRTAALVELLRAYADADADARTQPARRRLHPRLAHA